MRRFIRASVVIVVSAVAMTFVFTTARVLAQVKPAMTQGEAITESFTITAIDFKNRLITLKDKEGLSETIVAGPEVQRFDALKVGDVVTFRYYESLVTQIVKPGATAQAPTDKSAVVRTEGTKPGATLSRQMTATVTIEALDLKLSSVTIKQDDGSRSSFKVENPKNLQGLKPGDRVQITYTMALAVSVQAGK